MIPTLPIQVTCPQCGAQYAAQIRAIVDVGQEPALKAQVLRGRLNAVACPSCKTPGVVSAPLLYHDPSHELLLIYVPTELNLPLPDREKLTGNLVNTLMASVPQEQRKGYFLNPRAVLTLRSLHEEILQADGITREMMDRQRAQAQLVDSLLSVRDDETKLQELVDANRDKVDYSFFLTVTGAAEASAASGNAKAAEDLLDLRERLLAIVNITLPEPLPPETSHDELIDRLLAAADKDLRWGIVVYNRPLLTYGFFQSLTDRIGRVADSEADRLRSLRSDLLEMTEQLDKEARAVRESKLRLLQEVMESPDAVSALNERKEHIDGLFMAMLAATMQSAEEHGEKEEAQLLKSIYEAALALLQEDLPPGLRLVNQLLTADHPDGTGQLLNQSRDSLTPEFLELLQQLAADLSEQRPEVAKRLRELHVQAQSIVNPT